MKKLLPIIALFLLCLACAPPHKISNQKNNSPSPKNEKHIPISKQVTPKTCSLIIKDCVVISKNNAYTLNGKVESVKAYGAGFTEILQKNQSIRIKIREDQAKKIGNSKSIECSIAQINQMNDIVSFELLNFK